MDDSVEGVEAIVLVVDASRQGVGRGDAFVAQREVAPFAGKKICVVNKIDLLQRRGVVPQLAKAAALAEFDHIVPVSAKTGRDLGRSASVIVAAMPEGPRLFPGDETTDLPLETPHRRDRPGEGIGADEGGGPALDRGSAGGTGP